MAKRPTRFPNAIPPAVYVLDVSVAVTWVVRRLTTDYTLAVLRTIGRSTACVPGNWLSDLAEAARTAERAGWVAADDLDRHLNDINQYPILIDAHLHRHAWGAILGLARVHDLDMPHAAALELALRTQLPLATIDTRLRAAVARAGVALFTP